MKATPNYNFCYYKDGIYYPTFLGTIEPLCWKKFDFNASISELIFYNNNYFNCSNDDDECREKNKSSISLKQGALENKIIDSSKGCYSYLELHTAV